MKPKVKYLFVVLITSFLSFAAFSQATSGELYILPGSVATMTPANFVYEDATTIKIKRLKDADVGGVINTINTKVKGLLVKQFQFQAPSEHMVNGMAFPMEITIVQQKEGAENLNNLLSTGVLFDKTSGTVSYVEEVKNFFFSNPKKNQSKIAKIVDHAFKSWTNEELLMNAKGKNYSYGVFMFVENDKVYTGMAMQFFDK